MFPEVMRYLIDFNGLWFNQNSFLFSAISVTIILMAAQEQILNGRYKLLAQQAAGGMAVVYKAQDLTLGRVVAIKVMRPSLTSDQTFLVRFRQEARNVANLSHPNIVTVYDFGQDGNTYYIVMEYVDGQDLKKLIKASAPFSIDRTLNLAIQICAGVGYAHRAKVVHADVKPQNVLVTADDHVKVTDFGIAQVLSETQPRERQSVVWGSPHYFAPEQASGDPPSPASDVYAIGIVMFEMLTGKLPYVGIDQQALAISHLRDPVPHVMDFNPLVPVHLDRIVYKVMSKNPSDRYATADQLGRILIGYKEQGTDQTINQPQPGGPSPLKAPTVVGQSPQSQPPIIQPPTSVVPAQSASAPPANPYQLPYTPAQPAAGTYRPAASGQTPPQPQPVYPAPQPYQQPIIPQPYQPPGAAPQRPYQPPVSPTQQGQPQSYQPPYAQQPYQVYGTPSAPGFGAQPGTPLNQPVEAGYRMHPAPPLFDAATLALSIIAVLMVLGLLPFWLAVLSAYSR